MDTTSPHSSKRTERFVLEVAGRPLVIEIGKLAQKAHGSCTVQCGETVVLATCVMSEGKREGVNFLPLLVDYEEKLYAAGKIKGSRFIKREGRPSDEAILTSRLIDRSIRPLFSSEIRRDIQVILTVLSVDHENDPDVASLIAAACALEISSIPWKGPVAGVRIGRTSNGTLIVNPTYTELEESDLDLFVVGTEDRVVMIETGSKEVQEEVILEAVRIAQASIRDIVLFLRNIRQSVGQTKISFPVEEWSGEERRRRNEVRDRIRALIQKNLPTIFSLGNQEAQEQAIEAARFTVEEALKEDSEMTKDDREWGLGIFNDAIEEETRQRVLKEKKRVDGRSVDDIRPLEIEVGLLPRTHGSGLFCRGETQVLSVVTLGSPGDEQFLDGMEVEGRKRYMHHYNFPPFSTGEVSPLRSPGRREIGHGALAEKALLPILPNKDSFPYTIRVVSEVLSSNGSTSQASICGSSLALMDAGVPIDRPVAGISIGLVTTPDLSRYELLTDIQGIEDHAGDMDFKVAGTSNGITAIQLDVKVYGINLEIIKHTLDRAKKARLSILDAIKKVIAAPRAELSPYAPRIESLRINPDRIRDLIGPAGKVINEIIEKTGAAIDIEDDGLVMVTSDNAEKLKEALEWIRGLTYDVKVGEIYEGSVTQIIRDRMNGKEIGAIVEILPKQDGMVHISQISHDRIGKVTDVLKIGDRVKVKVMGVDSEKGRIELSMKALLPEPPFKSFEANEGRGGFFRRPRVR